MFRQITSTFGVDDLVERAFHLHQYGSPDQLEIGPFTVRLQEVPHFTTTFAADLASNGTRFTNGADCGPNDALVELARDTDLLMIEATLPRPERTGERGDLTPGEAGEHGRRAGARRVVLTHYSDELDADALSAAAGDRDVRRRRRARARGRRLHDLTGAAAIETVAKPPHLSGGGGSARTLRPRRSL